METPRVVRQHSWRDHGGLVPILGLAALLRLWQIQEPLWLDELHTAWVVAAGPSDLVQRAQIGNQSPVYFYLPWVTTWLFGTSEWALRLPSLAAGVGLVALAYGLAYQFTHSRIAAVTCSLLAACDHNFLFYATEARPYAWVQLVAAIQLWLFWRLGSGATPARRTAFVVATVALFYLHYTAILLVTGEIVYLAISTLCRRSTDPRSYRGRRPAIDLVIVAAAILPAAWHLASIGARRGAWASIIPDTSLLLAVRWFSLVEYVVVPAGVCLLVAVARQTILSRYGDTANATPSGSSSPSMLAATDLACLLLCWLGVPLTIVWFLTLTNVAPLYLGRYLIGAALAPLLMAGLSVGVWGGRRIQLLVAGVVLVFAIDAQGMIAQWQRDGRLFGDRVENWRAAVAYVNGARQPQVPVFVRSGLLEADRLATDKSPRLRKYCVLPVTSIYRIDGPHEDIFPLATSNPAALSESDVARVKRAAAAWFLINGTPNTRQRCERGVVAALQPAAGRAAVVARQQFGNVGVFLVVVDNSQTPESRRGSQPTSPNSSASP